ncbi:MAG TPA: hypothetical protein VH370_22875 [Humisphaera sp.]|nr:hypothetical protein [Humisphaera sp.]
MTTTTIQSIKRGIVFLMAEWSGGAQWAHRQLVMFLQQRGFPLEQLHVLDVDLHPELYGVPELAGKIHGWGEAAVIRDGRIILVTVLGKDRSRIHEHCDELVRACDA